MEELISPEDRKARFAPDRIREKALRQKGEILHIVWDKEDGYPEHAWGFEQWSVRPFQQGNGCDGTIDRNVHLIGKRLCAALGLDYKALYEEAYVWDTQTDDGSWILLLDRYEDETIIPELSELSLKLLLDDLGDINNRSLVGVLEDRFTGLGYDVSEWWEV